ncbi:unnamed protein product (macronuclear) [Paramecium tetraurelia]|uniref:Uncharacterized protein n=1 Tax=Paramecium tetraurelia TaxID=5888 RepID=A0CLA8_PARTE|nr:uncharacterized protein GSPATT00008122001 [Paramecium tetraurelia]CAK71575.1 unnamed protein product [Paramecium tetraurelia]|eukprot:XP_001438972.1 hypothetical protein (macronuclear) [Paramecium tetraurelia strain d4-2]
MGCCAIEPGHNRNKEKVFCEQIQQDTLNNQQSQDQTLQPKYQEQTMEKVTCEIQIVQKNNKNHLVALKENQYAVYNKDDLNAVEDQFFQDKHSQKPQEVDKANSDDDY